MVAKNAKWIQKMIYIVLVHLPFLLGDNFHSQILVSGGLKKKMNVLGDLKSSCYSYLPEKTSFVLCVKKDIVK